MTSPEVGFEEARTRDANDPLRDCRALFEVDSDIVYLDGNSLGPMPRAAASVMADVVNRQWARDLIRSWNTNDWIGAPQRIGGKIARLVDAAPHEVIVADSVSVNIFKLLSALTRDTNGRRQVLTEAGSFPTDVHVADGVAVSHGLELQLAPRGELFNRLTDQTAVLLLSHVHYKSGARFDMAAVNAAARKVQVPVVWDLSHSTGAVPLQLREDGAEYAVGCGYKYLNGGPGAPAFVYVAAERQAVLRPSLQGWMGTASPFAFDDRYEPGAGLNRLLVGTPPVLSLLALECGVDALAGVDQSLIWRKSQEMFDFLTELMDTVVPQLELITPRAAEERGSHASFASPNAWPINNALIARGVIGDFRTPDVLRFGLTPLYTSFEDIARAVATLHEIVGTEEWRKPEYSRAATVT